MEIESNEMIDIVSEPSLSYYCEKFGLHLEDTVLISIPRKYIFGDLSKIEEVTYLLDSEEGVKTLT